MTKSMKNIIIAIMIGVPVVLFALLLGSKVYAQSVEEARTEHREALESTYITTIRTMLDERGFENSGVNMTKVTNEWGEWEYTVTVYHDSFAWMEDAGKEELGNKLTETGEGSLGKISLTLLSR